MLILSVLFINSVSAELDGETILNLDKDILNPDEDIITMIVANQTYIGSYLNLDVERIDNSTFILHYELNETFKVELEKCKTPEEYDNFADKWLNKTESTVSELQLLDTYPIKSKTKDVILNKESLNILVSGTLDITTSGSAGDTLELGFGSITLKTIESKILNIDKKVVLENDYGLNLIDDNIVSYEYSYNNTCYSESDDLIIIINNCHQSYNEYMIYNIEIKNKQDKPLSYTFMVSSGNDISDSSIKKELSDVDSEYISKDMLGSVGDDFYTLETIDFKNNETVTIDYKIITQETSGKFNIIGYSKEYTLTDAITNKQYIFLDPTWDDAKVSYWNADSDGSFPDSWDSYDGTIDGATYTSDGYINGAYSYATNDKVNIGNIAAMNFERTDSFSVSTWFKTSTSAGMSIVSKLGSSAPYRGWDVFMESNGKISLLLVNTWASSALRVTSTAAYNDGDWKHLIITYDGTSLASGINIYVDGDLVADDGGSYTLSDTIQSTNHVTIGARNDGGGGFFTGTIDETAIFNDELTSDEVTDIYTNGLAPATDTCSEPSINTNHEFDLSDNCVINDDWNIGTGNITFINTGTITFNATIIAHNIASLPADQKGYLGEGARIRVG